MREQIERVAREFRLWAAGANAGGILMRSLGGRILITAPEHVISIGYPAAALLLVGHARGLRVDLGECPACRARGSRRGLARWEWAGLVRGRNYGGWTTSDGKLADHIERRWSISWTDHSHALLQHASRPCPACTVDGQPTGRETLAWMRAMLSSMLQPPCCAGVPVSQIECGCEGRWGPGDTHVIEALAVLADRMQVQDDALGPPLAAWLADPDGGSLLAEHEPALAGMLEQLAARGSLGA